jgi:DNA-binding PadR family transcriptional regulator
MMDRHRATQRFLPLRPVEFHVLLSLAAGERHGYSMLQDMETRGEASPPDVGTLYRALRRLEDQGLISGVRRRDVQREEERRNYFRLTQLGLEVARAEARRLEDLLRAARAEGLLQARPA